MAITIISESYGPRKPLIECTADSLDELAALECAEGSTATVGGTEYTLDRVNGWIVPGGGGGGGDILVVNIVPETEIEKMRFDKTASEMLTAAQEGKLVIQYVGESGVSPALLLYCGIEDGSYVFDFVLGLAMEYYNQAGIHYMTGTSYTFTAVSGSDYPQQTDII